MRRLSSALLRSNPDPPSPPRTPRRRDPDLLLDVPRCPCCRAPLVARQGRKGPSFYCLCRTKLFGKEEP